MIQPKERGLGAIIDIRACICRTKNINTDSLPPFTGNSHVLVFGSLQVYKVCRCLNLDVTIIGVQ